MKATRGEVGEKAATTLAVGPAEGRERILVGTSTTVQPHADMGHSILPLFTSLAKIH
jgi:hypothetical protein